MDVLKPLSSNIPSQRVNAPRREEEATLDQTICAICREIIEKGQKLYLFCKDNRHQLHEACATPWKLQGRNCPLCGNIPRQPSRCENLLFISVIFVAAAGSSGLLPLLITQCIK